MIAHDAFRLLAARALDGPLSDDDATELHRHRAGCTACLEFEARLRADAGALSRHRPLQLPGALDNRVAALLLDAPARGRWSPAAIFAAAMLMLVAAAASVAIGSYILQNRQHPPLPLRPAVPAGWTETMTNARDLRMAFPPYVVVQTEQWGLLANEAPADGQANWFSIMASGPRDTDQNPNGLSVEEWLLASLGEAGNLRELATFSTVALPSGVATRMHLRVPNGDAIDEAAYYAIETEAGLALVTVTGRAEDFVNHAADIDLVLNLWETGPSLSAAIGPRPARPELSFFLPGGWDFRRIPDVDAEAGEYVGFLSNAPLAADPCSRDAGGVQLCPDIHATPPPGTFVVGVLDTALNEPRYVPGRGSPAPDYTVVPIAGRLASRSIADAEVPGYARVIWELDLPAEHTGFLLFNVLLSTADVDRLLPQIEAVLASATLEDGP